MRTLDVRIEFTEEMLGTASADPEIHARFVASKAPEAPSMAEEVAALGADAVEERGMTVFPRDAEGRPILWDYQVKGFFKDACYMLKKVPGMRSHKMTTYKKDIDGLIFPTPRMIVLHLPEGASVGECQRPLRAQTAQGERVALAHSESVPAGTWCDLKVTTMRDEHVPVICEWLQYGFMRGLGQWRNSGKGRFSCVVSEGGQVLLDTTGAA